MKVDIIDEPEDADDSRLNLYAALWEQEKRLARAEGRVAIARVWTEATGWMELTDESEEPPE